MLQFSSLLLFYIGYICDGCFPEHEQGPISVTYDLLPKGSVLSFLWLQFPRMVLFLSLFSEGKQLKGKRERLEKEAEEQGR